MINQKQIYVFFIFIFFETLQVENVIPKMNSYGVFNVFSTLLIILYYFSEWFADTVIFIHTSICSLVGFF